MKNKIIATLASIIMAMGIGVAAAPQANASHSFTRIMECRAYGQAPVTLVVEGYNYRDYAYISRVRSAARIPYRSLHRYIRLSATGLNWAPMGPYSQFTRSQTIYSSRAFNLYVRKKVPHRSSVRFTIYRNIRFYPDRTCSVYMRAP